MFQPTNGDASRELVYKMEPASLAGSALRKFQLPGFTPSLRSSRNHLAVIEGYYLTGISVKWTGDYWKIIYHARCKKDRALIAFSGVQYWEDVWEFVAYELSNTRLSWKEDRYAK